MNWIILALLAYFLMMLAIGYVASKRMNNLSDYMLGGRHLNAAVTALSAGASDMSGWLLLGLPGSIFAVGLGNTWIVIGLLIGAYFNWTLLAPRLRVFTEFFNNSITIPDFLENRFGDKKRMLRIFSAVVVLIFFAIYTSSGMVSGGRLFETMFDLPESITFLGMTMQLPSGYVFGVLLTSLVVIIYTLFGGFLAVSWTDFVQGLIMVTALIIVPLMVIYERGGVAKTLEIIQEVDANKISFASMDWDVVAIISLLAWGLGYFGQPHIIVRFMAISSVKEMKKAKNIGMWWMLFSITGAVLIGLVGIAYFNSHPEHFPKDPETVFIILGKLLFHPFFVGFLMAAILSAVMSTISSQLLVTSSALTSDFYKAFIRQNASDREMLIVSRLSVLLVAALGLSMALNPNDKIMNIVAYAWAGLGASFGPVVLMSLYWKKMNHWGAFSGMLIGAVTVLAWKELAINPAVYEIIPGFLFNLIAIFVVSNLTHHKDQEVLEKQFEQAVEKSKNF